MTVKGGLQGIPIDLKPNTNVVNSGGTIHITSHLLAAATSATDINVNCDLTSVITSPSGSWPYVATIPTGASSVTFTITAATVTSTQAITVVAGPDGYDITDCTNWSAMAIIVVNP